MNKAVGFLLAALCLSLAGCAKNSATIEWIRNQLKDPDSAKFEGLSFIKYSKNGKVHQLVCGSVNAKNSYGGYTGFKPFVAHPVKGYLHIAPTTDINNATFDNRVALLATVGCCAQVEEAAKSGKEISNAPSCAALKPPLYI